MIVAELGAAVVGAGGAVMVALIGGPIMFLMSRFDRRNTEQHAENKAVQEETIREIQDVKTLVALAAERATSADRHAEEASRNITTHLAWHLAPQGNDSALALLLSASAPVDAPAPEDPEVAEEAQQGDQFGDVRYG
jgi:ABC-type bacteriocin/lantibiotic exporter with double-glycine peptidase domain